jgi:hypothetical protein
LAFVVKASSYIYLSFYIFRLYRKDEGWDIAGLWRRVVLDGIGDNFGHHFSM